jgi:adenosyl cobinamide kinase/adenosyl cobinamide phosphate guanylyltransferase
MNLRGWIVVREEVGGGMVPQGRYTTHYGFFDWSKK